MWAAPTITLSPQPRALGLCPYSRNSTTRFSATAATSGPSLSTAPDPPVRRVRLHPFLLAMHGAKSFSTSGSGDVSGGSEGSTSGSGILGGGGKSTVTHGAKSVGTSSSGDVASGVNK